MATAGSEEKHAERAKQQQQRAEAVARLVRRALGGPDGSLTVQVRPLWDNHYRVNVLAGEGPSSFTIARSYFLEVDGEGKLLASAPALP
jgi:hypothetical protein